MVNKGRNVCGTQRICVTRLIIHVISRAGCLTVVQRNVHGKHAIKDKTVPGKQSGAQHSCNRSAQASHTYCLKKQLYTNVLKTGLYIAKARNA